MKKTILASVGSVLLFVLSPAFAADMPVMPVKGVPAPYIAPYYNWTGFYVGFNAGYGFGQSNWSVGGVSTGDFNLDGFVAGATVGYNFQTGAIVWGLEGDFDYSNIKGSTTAGICALGCTTANQWLGTARFRLGYAFDRWLPYLTAGGAFGDVKATSVLGSSSSTEFGWTAGAGIEWAFLSNWTAKIEYLYVDLGSGTCTGACSAVPINVDFKTSLVRGGINYRF